MKAVNDIFVHIPKKIKDTIILKNGATLFLAGDYDRFSNRAVSGTVVSVPLKWQDIFREGDEVFYHHTVITGKNRCIDWEEGVFKVQYTKAHTYDCLVYLINREGVYTTTNDWVFVKPFDEKREEKIGSIYIPDLNPPKQFRGEICFCNDYVESELGVREGDVIVWSKDSEYAIEVEGVVYYRMKMDDIMAVL